MSTDDLFDSHPSHVSQGSKQKLARLEWLRNRTIANFRLDPQLSSRVFLEHLYCFAKAAGLFERFLEAVGDCSNHLLVDAQKFRAQTTNRPPLGGEITLLGEGETEACGLAFPLGKVCQYDAV